MQKKSPFTKLFLFLVNRELSVKGLFRYPTSFTR